MLELELELLHELVNIRSSTGATVVRLVHGGVVFWCPGAGIVCLFVMIVTNI